MVGIAADSGVGRWRVGEQGAAAGEVGDEPVPLVTGEVAAQARRNEHARELTPAVVSSSSPPSSAASRVCPHGAFGDRAGAAEMRTFASATTRIRRLCLAQRRALPAPAALAEVHLGSAGANDRATSASRSMLSCYRAAMRSEAVAPAQPLSGASAGRRRSIRRRPVAVREAAGQGSGSPACDRHGGRSRRSHARPSDQSSSP